MFSALANAAAGKVLNGVKEKFVNPHLDGICRVKEISFRDKRLRAILTLDGLDNQDIDISCDHVAIAADGSSVSLSGFSSNMPFAENALNRFAPKEFAIPEGAPRLALIAARKVLGLAD